MDKPRSNDKIVQKSKQNWMKRYICRMTDILEKRLIAQNQYFQSKDLKSNIKKITERIEILKTDWIVR